jgi:HD-GYP domain-containing protein (c-di-GMP phosphodiesterase class II)
MRRISRSDLVINKPLPWDVYDQEGKLLLKTGFVLSVPRYIDDLLERGSFYDEKATPAYFSTRVKLENVTSVAAKRELVMGASFVTDAPKVPNEPVYSRAETININIRRIHKLALEARSLVNLDTYVRTQAKHLIAAVDEDADSVVAAGHVNRQPKDFRVNQQFLGASLAAVLAPMAGIGEKEREALVCAALTRDVGILHVDTLLECSKQGEMSEFLKRSVTDHTRNSVSILKERGIHDPFWLRLILQHHEQLDGGGYPGGVTGDVLTDEVRLLVVVDSYAAMVIPSERRKGMFSANAIRELFLKKGTLYDERHIAILYKYLTKHPPGSLVSLANGEVAVVKNRQPGERPPMVWSVYDRNGMPRLQPIIRDTANAEFSVTGVVAAEQCRSAELIMKRVWLKP